MKTERERKSGSGPGGKRNQRWGDRGKSQKEVETDRENEIIGNRQRLREAE